MGARLRNAKVWKTTPALSFYSNAERMDSMATGGSFYSRLRDENCRTSWAAKFQIGGTPLSGTIIHTLDVQYKKSKTDIQLDVTLMRPERSACAGGVISPVV